VREKDVSPSSSSDGEGGRVGAGGEPREKKKRFASPNSVDDDDMHHELGVGAGHPFLPRFVRCLCSCHVSAMS